MKIRSFLFFSILGIGSSGCATLVSQVQNDPTNNQPSGDRVFISFSMGKENKDGSDTILGKTVINEASKWLTTRGYKIVDKRRSADTSLDFKVDSESKIVHVPGETYSVPVYGNNQGTTSVVKGAYGQTLGYVETQPTNPYAPTGYQTHYREAYNENVADRWLFMGVWKQVRGSVPQQISKGQIYPEKYNQQFFESQTVMAQAVGKILSESVFSSVQRAPASLSQEDPGCWPRIGLTFDEKEKLERGARINDFGPGSKAESAGLKIGDVVISIAGHEIPDPKPVRFQEGTTVNIVAERDGKRLSFKVMPTMQCIN